MYLWKWYDKKLMGWWNVRNSEEKGGWKYDISESQYLDYNRALLAPVPEPKVSILLIFLRQQQTC